MSKCLIFSNMACAYNVFIQGINAMVYHARKVQEDQIQDFMLFCVTLVCLFSFMSCYEDL